MQEHRGKTKHSVLRGQGVISIFFMGVLQIPEKQLFIHELQSYELQIRRGDSLSGPVLGNVLKRLTEMEVAEGGPYAFGNKIPDFELNITIGNFLSALNVQLPQLDEFLKDSAAHSADNTLLYEDFLKLRIKQITSNIGVTNSATQDFIMERIRNCANERFSDLSIELRDNASYLIERTIAGNNDRQMTLMAFFMREALGSRGEIFSDEYIAELGLANVFFWSAFIAYDDFWDEDDAAQPKLLPVANLFARHYTNFFSERLGNFFHTLMDKLDGANAWEIANCRLMCAGKRVLVPEKLPDYGDFSIKFYPAAGHILGPLSMIVEMSSQPGSLDFKNLVDYFRHYLVAMQINDDSHDWKEDLERGHISTAVYCILALWKQEHPKVNWIDLDKNMAELEELFWFRVLEPLCLSVLQHAQQSRYALSGLSFVEDPAPLENFIIRNENIARRAIQEQKMSTELITAFT